LTDEKARKAIDDRVTRALSEQKWIENAISAVDQIAETQNKLTAERDRIAREKAAGEMLAKADALTAKLEVARIANLELSEALDSVSALPYEAVDFRPRVKTLLAEIPAAVAQFASDIRKHAERIKAGQEPIPGAPRKVEQPAPTPQIERREIYLLQDSRWTENGEIKTAQRYALVALPIEIANRAIEHKLAVDPASETCARLKVVHGMRYGITYADLCTDLESGERPDNAPKYFEVSGEPVLGERVVGVASIS
jgi:hypothetical protein